TNLLLISSSEEDHSLVSRLADLADFDCGRSTDVETIESYIKDYPRTLIVWDGNDIETSRKVISGLKSEIPRTKMFVLSDGDFQNHVELEKVPWAYHLTRKQDKVSQALYTRIFTS